MQDKHNGGKPSKECECRRGANKLHHSPSQPGPNSDACEKRRKKMSFFVKCNLVHGVLRPTLYLARIERQ